MPTPLAEDPLAEGLGQKRKLRQLCRQVERVLSTAIADDCADDVLLELMITAVLPWPNASRLLVVVCPSSFDAPIDRDTIIRHLTEHRGLLRSIVAGSINRKRTPNLCFEVMREHRGE